jgi:tetratricopeptide (TPR) repeat protein
VTVVEELCRELQPRLWKMSKRESREALARLREAQRSAPRDQFGNLFHMIGLICRNLGDLQAALDAHRNAARYEPQLAVHLNNITGVLLDLRRFQDALRFSQESRTKEQTQTESLASWLNTSEAYHGLGNASEAREAFDNALRQLDPTSAGQAIKMAYCASIIGAEEDAVELFARYIALDQGKERGNTPAVEIIRATSGVTVLTEFPALARAIERVTIRWDAPIPEEHQIASEIHMSPEGSAQLANLVEHPPVPSEALRRLHHAART